MEDAIERAAHISVGRACGFGALAILCIMVGFSFDPHLSSRAGGSFALVMSMVLAFKSWWVQHQNYRHTETWLILSVADRPPPLVSAQIIPRVLRGVFLIYARYAAVLAVGLLATSMVLAK
jgi:hypothetical protein